MSWFISPAEARALARSSKPALSNRVETSDEAARAIESRRETLRFVVLNAIRVLNGATAQEIEDFTHLAGNTIRPRLVELREANLIIQTTEKRKTRSGRNAFVYRVP